MARLGQAMGAELETLTGLSGLGDIVLTATGLCRATAPSGLALAGVTLAAHMSGRRQVVEGGRRRRHVLARAHRLESRCRFAPPSMLSLHREASLDEAIRALLARPLRREGKMKAEVTPAFGSSSPSRRSIRGRNW